MCSGQLFCSLGNNWILVSRSDPDVQWGCCPTKQHSGTSLCIPDRANVQLGEAGEGPTSVSTADALQLLMSCCLQLPQRSKSQGMRAIHAHKE